MSEKIGVERLIKDRWDGGHTGRLEGEVRVEQTRTYHAGARSGVECSEEGLNGVASNLGVRVKEKDVASATAGKGEIVRSGKAQIVLALDKMDIVKFGGQ